MLRLIVISAIIFALTGCSQEANINNHAVLSSTQTWIQFTDTSHDGYFIVTNTPIAKVGQQIGFICPDCRGPSYVSNNLRSGIRLYEIPGENVRSGFAVETSNGHYFQAVLYGTNKP